MGSISSFVDIIFHTHIQDLFKVVGKTFGDSGEGLQVERTDKVENFRCCVG